MDTATVDVTRISVDPALQPRVEGIDPEHVRELEAVAEHWPPLKVARRSERYILVDGFHRFAAAQNLKLQTVTAEILDLADDEDLHAVAFALNAAHGRPLTLSDRRAFAARVLRRHPDWSDREIGRHCGLVQPTIAKVRQELEQTADIQPSETRVGRDGRTYNVAQPTGSGGSGFASVIAEAITNIFTPAERRAQRQLVRYLEDLAATLEKQESFLSFETVDLAAEACLAVLGAQAAKELGERLGWSSAHILDVGRKLGYRENQT
ncbi:MAG TPA: ParB/RepB/Spo0J family partition protein [Bradyrhizobium sp.]|nr:ParB/RepB/Spo0J family partition protein [Bradyrhizobium sp.]